jgi:hypothetical protein
MRVDKVSEDALGLLFDKWDTVLCFGSLGTNTLYKWESQGMRSAD